MNERPVIRILLVEDDEEDYIITRDLLSEIRGRRFIIEWKQNYSDGLAAMQGNNQDVSLVDYRLGVHDGLELLKAARAAGAEAPVILVTGQGHEDVDMAAMAAGAADYIVKGQVNAHQLERTIRYAIERKRAASKAAFEQARLASFGTQVGLELARRAPLEAQLENCARAMTQFLNCALAQIWTYDSQVAREFIPCAHACDGQELLLTTLDFPNLVEGRPVFLGDLEHNPTFAQHDWVQREQFVSFAAYPLVVESQVVGCVSLLSREPLAETVLQEIASVANGMALCIQREQGEAQVQKLAAFPRVNPDPVLEFSADGQLTYSNEAATNLSRALGKEGVVDLLPSKAAELVARCLASGSKKIREVVSVSGRTLSWSFVPVPDSQVVHCYGTDMTND